VQPVHCPYCQASLAASSVLDACTAAIPRSAIVRFRCPGCGREEWARLGGGELAIGAPRADSALFRPFAVADEPDLCVRRGDVWLDCWHDGCHRRFPWRSLPASA